MVRIRTRNPKYRLIAKMLHKERFYQGIDTDGNLKLLSNIALRFPQDCNVTERHLVAVALTEVCRVHGIGKLLYLSVPLPVKPVWCAPTADHEIWEECLQAHGRLPALIYVPFDWSPLDQEIWDAWTPKDRLISLNARAGTLKRQDVVLPLDLTFFLEAPEDISLNGFSGADGGYKAVLTILPKVYLGWHSAIRTNDQETSDWYTVGEAALE